MPLDPSRFSILTFDCYGTLIDWETGILSAMRQLLAAHGVDLPDERVLEMYAALETEAESGAYRPYRSVLASVVEGFGRSLAFDPSPAERASLAESIASWIPFPDTVPALKRLHEKYRLAILSNVDDDLFTGTAGHLGISFDLVVTAQQVKAYKPSPAFFDAALRRIGLPTDGILHVAQSLHHDILPAGSRGLASVWIDRRHGRPGFGATPRSEARPDLTLPDLKSLADMLLPG